MIKSQLWFLYAIFSAFFAALTAIFAKLGLKNVHADLATAIRTSMVLFLVWGIALFRNTAKELPLLSSSNWLFLFLSAMATGLSWIFYYRALQLGTASEVSAVDRTSIVFVFALSFIFLREPMTTRLITGAGLILAGLLVLVWK